MHSNNLSPTEMQNRINNYKVSKFNWRRIHRSWIFWVFWILMLTGIGYYIISVDFAFTPTKVHIK